MKHTGSFFITLVAISIFLIMFPTTAFASPAKTLAPLASCSQSGCNNTDPYSTRCSDAFKAVSQKDVYDIYGIKTGTIYEEYSTICDTNWAEFHSTATSPSPSVTLYARIERFSGPDGSDIQYSYSSTACTWINTNQVYSPNNQAQACGHAEKGS